MYINYLIKNLINYNYIIILINNMGTVMCLSDRKECIQPNSCIQNRFGNKSKDNLQKDLLFKELFINSSMYSDSNIEIKKKKLKKLKKKVRILEKEIKEN
jgi:hypothetical protein